jgi:hypothetical protein
MNNYLTNQKYNTSNFEKCNNFTKIKTSNKLTPEYLINNGWKESGIAGSWYDKPLWYTIYTFTKSYPHIGEIYFKYSFNSEQIMIANVDDMKPSIGKNYKYEFQIIRTIDDLKKVMEMEFICEKLKL